jgi:hypothetical protein
MCKRIELGHLLVGWQLTYFQWLRLRRPSKIKIYSAVKKITDKTVFSTEAVKNRLNFQ